MKGLSKVKSNIKSKKSKIIEATEKGIFDVATIIFDDSMNNYVPVDTGELRASADITQIFRPSTYTAIVSYDTDYAIYVHEISYYYHAHGSWKYLELPFNKHLPKLPAAIRARLLGVL